jgi:hypothetical protein
VIRPEQRAQALLGVDGQRKPVLGRAAVGERARERRLDVRDEPVALAQLARGVREQLVEARARLCLPAGAPDRVPLPVRLPNS